MIRIPAHLWIAPFFVVYFALAVHSEYWLGVVTTHPLGDDFKIYYGAYIKALAGENPYEPYGIGSGFIYHPSALSFVSLFSWSGDQWLATYAWIAASGIAWAGSIVLAVRLAQSAWADESRASAKQSGRSWLVAGVFLGFAPFWETIHIGQINAFAVLCLVLTFYWAQQNRDGWAGVMLALAIVLKTSPIVLLACFALQHKFKLIAVALAVILFLSFLAIMQFSPQIFQQFWAILPRLGSEIHPDTYNQSITSILYQSLPFLENYKAALVLGHRVLSAGATGGLLLSGLLAPLRNARRRLWLFMLLLVVIVFFSPLVWYHHSTLLLLPLSALLLSPQRWIFVNGLGLVLLLQAERLFEQTVTLTAYPIPAAHLTLIAVLGVVYCRGAGRDQSEC